MASKEGFDTIILAADRRTLILDLQVSPDRIDQMRVLVEAPRPPVEEGRAGDEY